MGPPLHSQSIFPYPIHFFPFQKSLPLLENQIKNCYQSASEELQKYGADIPEDDNEKTFFLIEVSVLYSSRHNNCITVYSALQIIMPPRLMGLHPAHLVFKKKGIRTETVVECRVGLEGGIFILSTLTEEFSPRILKERGEGRCFLLYIFC